MRGPLGRWLMWNRGKSWLHWFVLHAVPQVYIWAWSRRGYFWLQIVTDPAADPVPLIDKLHSCGGPVPVCGLLPIVRAYLVGHHHIVAEALRSDDLHVLPNRRQRLPGPMRWIEKATRPDILHPLRPPSLNSMEGPDHIRLKKSVSSFFSAGSVDSELIGAVAEELIDEIEMSEEAFDDPEGWISSEPYTPKLKCVDILHGFCRELPAAIIGSIFGLTMDDMRAVDYFRPFDSALTVLDVNLDWPTYQRNERALEALLEFIREQLDIGPPEGLPQVLARDPGLSDRERMVTCALILEAGFVTTANMLGNGIRLLLEHPDQLDILRRNPGLWPNAVEEILRNETPLRFTTRIAVRDTVLAGQKIKKNQIVVLNIAAANRDPAVFPDPHRFDVTRENARQHVGFSAGRHYCIGPALARAEAVIGLPMLFERFPGLRLASEPVRDSRHVMNCLSKLEVDA
jgi:cytochrome P450